MQLLPAIVRRASRHSRDRVALVVVVSFLSGLACKYPAAGSRQIRPDALIVLPGATDVRDTNENDGTVLYELNQDYPALPVTQTITARLESSGWRPLREEFLNPGLSTSLVRGWVSVEDRTTGRPTQVYQWVGQWEDASRRIVWYVFAYDAVPGPGGEIRALGPLKVRATVLSAATVRRLQEIAAKNRRVPK
jgi:hypothetical protein